jgi:CcdB protein
MPRFDVYKNPNPQGTHAFYLDIQSDLVTTATRWCIPLRMAKPGQPVVSRAQALVKVQGSICLMDTPNLLAVPNTLLRSPVDRLDAAGQAMAEAAVEFMLRGY